MLRRDPYAIYAESILKLIALPPLGKDIGVHVIGSAIHNVLEDFDRLFPSGPLPPNARDALIAMLDERLSDNLKEADFRAFRWPQILRAIEFYLAFEAGRRDDIDTIAVEVSGTLPFSSATARSSRSPQRPTASNIAKTGA